MEDCSKCLRTDVKYCFTCKKDSDKCKVWHHCRSDFPEHESRIKTNADCIRSMSDEELAEFINFGSPDCSGHCADFKPGCSFSCNHNHGNDVILKWLQSEAE